MDPQEDHQHEGSRSTAAPPPESVVKDTISQTHAGSPSLSPTAASRHSWAVVVFKWMPHTIHRYRVRDPVGCGALSKGFTSFQQQNMVSSLAVQARVGRKSQNFKLHENNDVEFKSVAFAASYPFVCASGVSWRERIPFNVNMNGSPWQTDTMT